MVLLATVINRGRFFLRLTPTPALPPSIVTFGILPPHPRYKNFRTLVTPQPAQLTSLALDGSGEVVVAGAMDPFEVNQRGAQQRAGVGGEKGGLVGKGNATQGGGGTEKEVDRPTD